VNYKEATYYTEKRTKVYLELRGDQVIHLVTEKNADLYLELRHEKPDMVKYFDKEYELTNFVLEEGFFII